MPLVSVVIPCYNEAENLQPLYERLRGVAESAPSCEFEFLFVDDGSTDGSRTLLAQLRSFDPRVKVVHFSRNFGSHAADLAGLSYARGDYSVIIGADLQDPPEIILEMLARMEEGHDVVFALRSDREDSRLTVWLANLYHWLMKRYAIASWPQRGADVVMLRRAVRDILVGWKQKNTSIFGQVSWTGFRQCCVFYVKQRRQRGVSHWTTTKKIKLAVDSFVSFSFAPIRLISYSGMVISVLGFLYALYIVSNKLLGGQPAPGWASLMVIMLVLFGFQLLMLGVIGEYLWRAVDEVRGTPPFIVEYTLGIERRCKGLPEDTRRQSSEELPTRALVNR